MTNQVFNEKFIGRVLLAVILWVLTASVSFILTNNMYFSIIIGYITYWGSLNFDSIQFTR